jgi:hypothetical protein
MLQCYRAWNHLSNPIGLPLAYYAVSGIIEVERERKAMKTETKKTRKDETMTTTTARQTAEYKGRKYRLAWMGQTKYGRRAKLAFFDGSKEFWVDAGKVSIVSQASSSDGQKSYRTEYCGYPCPVTGRKCCSKNGPCHDCM